MFFTLFLSIYISYFLMPEVITQDRNCLFPLSFLIKSFSFHKPLYFTVYIDLCTWSEIFSEGIKITESRNEICVFTLSRESQFLGFPHLQFYFVQFLRLNLILHYSQIIFRSFYKPFKKSNPHYSPTLDTGKIIQKLNS